jgi:hypothetical protein
MPLERFSGAGLLPLAAGSQTGSIIGRPRRGGTPVIEPLTPIRLEAHFGARRPAKDFSF